MPSRFKRMFACLLVLGVAAFGINDLSAICGAPNMVIASNFGGGTGWVVLFNPVPAGPNALGQTGIASVPLTTTSGQAQFNMWLQALQSSPTNFLYVIAGGPPPSCNACLLTVNSGFCPGVTVTTIMYD